MTQGSYDHSASASGLILVVEDEPLIALDMIEALEAGLFQVMGPATTVKGALSLLDRYRPAAAVLDLNLHRELSTPVARRLRGLGIPFVIASACPPQDMPQDAAVQDALKLGKPVSSDHLVSTLKQLVAG